MTNREMFEDHYRKEGGCLLASVKENHWRTWLAAQVAMLETQDMNKPKLPTRMAMQEPT
jgi:hypothetical protein